jgi:hypothetical protein
MAKDEIEFIKKEIIKTGFPLEIEISSILKEDRWEVMSSAPYFDMDESRWREINIKAYKSAYEGSQGKLIKPYRLTLALIIECKKSEEFAWVFFPQPRHKEELRRMTNIQFLDFLTVIKRQSLLKEEFYNTKLVPSSSELQLLNIDPRLISEEGIVTPEIARNMKFLSELEIISPEAFRHLIKERKALAYKEIKVEKKRKKGQSSEIFEAVNTLIKAMKYELKLSSNGVHAAAYLMKRKLEKGAFEIDIFLPILIFDGNYTRGLMAM